MLRACLVILAVMSFALQGCAVLEYLDGSPREEENVGITPDATMASKGETLPDDSTNADFGDYPASIREIVKAYFKDKFGVSWSDRDLDIKRPKKYRYRTEGKTNIYGYATKVIIEDNKEFFAMIRDNTVVYFGLWDASRYGSGQFDDLPTVDIHSHDLGKYTTYEMRGNQIRQPTHDVGGPKEPRGDIELNLKSSVQGDRIACQLVVAYHGCCITLPQTIRKNVSWLFIQRGESLILTVDNERMVFSCGGGEEKVVRRSSDTYTLTEIVWYDITHDQIEKIVTSSKIEVEVVGSKFVVNGFFTEDNFYNFRKFYQTYVSDVLKPVGAKERETRTLRTPRLERS